MVSEVCLRGMWRGRTDHRLIVRKAEKRVCGVITLLPTYVYNSASAQVFYLIGLD